MAEKVLHEESRWSNEHSHTVYLVPSAKWFSANRSNPFSWKPTTDSLNKDKNKQNMKGTIC